MSLASAGVSYRCYPWDRVTGSVWGGSVMLKLAAGTVGGPGWEQAGTPVPCGLYSW